VQSLVLSLSLSLSLLSLSPSLALSLSLTHTLVGCSRSRAWRGCVREGSVCVG